MTLCLSVGNSLYVLLRYHSLNELIASEFTDTYHVSSKAAAFFQLVTTSAG